MDNTEKVMCQPVMCLLHSASVLSGLFDWFQSAADSVEWKERLIKGQRQTIFPIWERAPWGLEVLAVVVSSLVPLCTLHQNSCERQILGLILFLRPANGECWLQFTGTKMNTELPCRERWLAYERTVWKPDSTKRSVVLQTKFIYPSLKHWQVCADLCVCVCPFQGDEVVLQSTFTIQEEHMKLCLASEGFGTRLCRLESTFNCKVIIIIIIIIMKSA